MEAACLFPHRISIVTGHYGTGKTEFSVNLALQLSAEGHRTALADLDIVNPYFRSRERRKEFEQAGVRLICSSQACADADVPSLPPELLTILEDTSLRGVLDIGGDPVGARVLARFRPQLMQQDHQLIYVLNANRPEVKTPEKAIACLRNIEEVTGLTCTALVNNTHLCGETTPAEIEKGAGLAAVVSRETGIPIVCHVVQESLLCRTDVQPIFPITIKMKKPWE